MNNRRPWLVPGVPWKTEAAFWGWIRGVLRKGWSKHPVKLEYIKKNRRRIVNPNISSRTRFPEVWGMACAKCNVDHVQTNIEIDHIGESGKFTCLDDIKDYAAHLFLVDFDCLRAVCKPCHKIISHSQRTGVSFEEAAIQKKVIEINKESTEKLLDLLKQHGYSGTTVSNATKRKAVITKLLKEKKIGM